MRIKINLKNNRHNFIPIRFKTTEPEAFKDERRPN